MLLLHRLFSSPHYRVAVEKPTSRDYGFSGTGRRSAQTDVALYERGHDTQALIEFKADNRDTGICKDLEKLIREEQLGAWFHTLSPPTEARCPALLTSSQDRLLNCAIFSMTQGHTIVSLRFASCATRYCSHVGCLSAAQALSIRYNKRSTRSLSIRRRGVPGCCQERRSRLTCPNWSPNPPIAPLVNESPIDIAAALSASILAPQPPHPRACDGMEPDCCPTLDEPKVVFGLFGFSNV